jgi:hypothetical protein
MMQQPDKEELFDMLLSAFQNRERCIIQHDGIHPWRTDIIDGEAAILRCGHIFCKYHMDMAADAPEYLRTCLVCKELVYNEYIFDEQRRSRLRKVDLGPGDGDLYNGTDSRSSDSDPTSSHGREHGRQRCDTHGYCSRERCPDCGKCRNYCRGGQRF